ncbi:MAG: hypothetical protein ACYC0V_20150, partial [Armatimonadota bacterium]
MRLSLDSQPYAAKPSHREMAHITQRLKCSSVSSEEFRDKVVTGYAFSPGVFKGDQASVTNWLEAQLIVTDVEYGLNPTQAIDKCFELGLPPMLGYPSYSSTAVNPRFHLVWHLPEPCTDRIVYKAALVALIRLFPGADKQCSDLARRFYGTNQPAWLWDPEAMVTPWQIVQAHQKSVCVSDPSHASRILADFARTTQLIYSDGVIYPPGNPLTMVDATASLDILNGHGGSQQRAGENWRNDVPPYKESTYNLVHIFTKSPPVSDVNPIAEAPCPVSIYSVPELGNHNQGIGSSNKLIRRFDFAAMEKGCEAYRRHMVGEPLDHNITMGLLYSLLRIRGGENKFKDGLCRRAEWSNAEYQREWLYYIRMTKGYGYRPQRCTSFCQWVGLCDHGLTPIDSVPLRRGQIRRIADPEPLISLEEASRRMQEGFEAAMDAPDDAIYLIRAETSLGKTTLYTENASDCLVCVPTHKLALEDVYPQLRIARPDEEVLYIPGIPKDEAVSDLHGKLDRLYSAGAYQEANRLTREHVEEMQVPLLFYDDVHDSERQLDARVRGIDELKTRKWAGTALITHEMMAHLPDNIAQHTLLIDEDPFPSMLDTGSVAISAITAVEGLRVLAGYILSQAPGIWNLMP